MQEDSKVVAKWNCIFWNVLELVSHTTFPFLDVTRQNLLYLYLLQLMLPTSNWEGNKYKGIHIYDLDFYMKILSKKKKKKKYNYS